MLVILLCWIYIFATSYLIGRLTIRLVFRKKYESSDNMLSVLLGMIIVMILTGYFSIFFPVHYNIHILLIALSIFSFLQSPPPSIPSLLKSSTASYNMKWLWWTFIVVSILFVLKNSAGIITNQDTGAYHLPFVNWTEQYGVIKGMANVLHRLGFNYQYLVLASTYGFHFLNDGITLHPLNGFLLITLIIYLASNAHIDERWKQIYMLAKYIILVVVINMSSSASSLSPDFPATALQLFIVLEWVRLKINNADRNHFYLLFFLMVGAVLFKLSSIMLLVFFIPFFIRELTQRTKKIAYLSLVCIVAVMPYLIRNYYISGYLIYPFYQLDIFNVPWKVPLVITIFEKEVVLFFALGMEYGTEYSFGEMISSWWRSMKTANAIYQPLLILLGLSFLGIFFLGIGAFIKKNLPSIWVLLFSFLFVGIVFWFLQMPDPRFGNGVILPFIAFSLALILSTILQYIPFLNESKRTVFTICFTFILAVSSFACVAQLLGFSVSKPKYAVDKELTTNINWITQAPYPASSCIDTTQNNGLTRKITDLDMNYWEGELPCAWKQFKYKNIGPSVTDGFVSGYDTVILKGTFYDSEMSHFLEETYD